MHTMLHICTVIYSLQTKKTIELSSFMMNKKYQIIYLARFAITVFLLNYQIP